MQICFFLDCNIQTNWSTNSNAKTILSKYSIFYCQYFGINPWSRLICNIQTNWSLDITHIYMKQAEKLKSREMKEGWMKNLKDEWRMMKDAEGWRLSYERWWFQAVEGFCFLMDRRTNGRTFVNVESLSWLKIHNL